ncbi:MAG: photosystem I reaction center subunit XII [Burkholderiales bacterium]|nr:photosystem I reaction center subunit XII [Burkholderiales bacterium]
MPTGAPVSHTVSVPPPASENVTRTCTALSVACLPSAFSIRLSATLSKSSVGSLAAAGGLSALNRTSRPA